MGSFFGVAVNVRRSFRGRDTIGPECARRCLLRSSTVTCLHVQMSRWPEGCRPFQDLRSTGPCQCPLFVEAEPCIFQNRSSEALEHWAEAGRRAKGWETPSCASVSRLA